MALWFVKFRPGREYPHVARIQKAKKAGLVEKVGWGQYQLTEDGKKIRKTRLHLVSSEGV